METIVHLYQGRLMRGYVRGKLRDDPVFPSAVHYPTVDETCAPFRERGFACEVRPLWGRTPFNSYLFTCRAPE